MSASAMARLGITLLCVAAIAGLLLLVSKGIVVLWFGLAGVLLAVLYSLGPIRLASIGLGELAVAVAFGLPVIGAAWLQSGVVDINVVLFAVPIAAWVTAILLINEVPDMNADGATGKRTLPVRLGLGGTSVLYLALHLVAAATVVWLTLRGGLPLLAPLAPGALLVLAWMASQGIRQGIADRPGMTKAIEMTLGIQAIGTIWLAACALFVSFFAS
jgi:1,4-dihydroxy-2-naphthoate octaprenyltransferase